MENSGELVNVYSNQKGSNDSLRDKIIECIGTVSSLLRSPKLETLKIYLEGYKKEERPSFPKKIKFEIRATKEVACQRAIFNSTTKLDGSSEVDWKDVELPVVFGRYPKRPSIDLIGELKDSRPVLCELKFVKAGKKYRSDSPIYATIELLIYYYLITKNCLALQDGKIRHTNGKDFSWPGLTINPVLIVSANGDYWRQWKEFFQRHHINFNEWSKDLPLKVQFYSFPDFDFDLQKQTKIKDGLYTPDLGLVTEWEEVTF